MTEEHKKALAEGRKRYFDNLAEAKKNYDPCSDCITIDVVCKHLNIPVDRDNCPVKCRYNKEVNTGGNNE